MNSAKQIKLGAILSYLQMALTFAVNLIYIPLMISVLGKAEYGLYSATSSTISMLSILNLGFSSSYIRYYSKYKTVGDEDGVAKTNGLFLIIFIVIGIIAFISGMYLSNNLELVFKNGLTYLEYKKAKRLMVILTINLTISFPMCVFTNIITSQEKFVFLKSLGIIKTVCSPLLTIPLLLNGFGLVSVVIVTLIVSVIVDLSYLLYCFKVLSTRFIFHDFDKGIFKDILIFTSFLAINIIVNQINLNIDVLIIGRYKGTKMVAVYTVGQTLYTYFQLLSTSISNLFTPKVYFLVNNFDGIEQKKRLTDLFVKVGRIQFFILSLICTGIIFFGKSFITNHWAGKGYADSYYILLLLAIPSMIPLTQNVGLEIQRAENKHKFRSIVYLIMALLNLGISIILCQKYAAIGCAIGTCVSFIIANGLIINIYYHKRCNIDIFAYWKNILSMSIGLIIPIFVGSAILYFVDTSSFLIFVIFVLLYSIVYSISMWIFSLNKFEKELFFNVFSKMKLHNL